MDLITSPPPPEVIAALAAVDGVQFSPTTLTTQTGPDGHLGPEDAGAILILQGTFVDESGFHDFWIQTVELVKLLATTPGFIRRWAFADGPHYTLIAWWRSVEDAHAFFSSDEHQRAIRATFGGRWQYTHFAGLWQVGVPRQRHFFCQACDAVVPSTEPLCTGCGGALPDPLGGMDVPAAAGVS